MAGHYFISYSRIEASDFATRLADLLIAGPPSYQAWLDVRDIRPGRDWDEQIGDAIKESRGLLFVMTPDSVQDLSSCKDEWNWALKYKKPVIPLRADPQARLPFRLSSRQYIDFAGSFDIGLARLRDHFVWLGTPGGVLQDLRYRLADAERQLPRTTDDRQRIRIEQDVRDLRQRITAQETLTADPQVAAARTSDRIAVGLEGQREADRPPPRGIARARFVNTAPMTAPSYFQDRHVETEMLADFLRADDARLATVVGRGGVGKTAMVCRLLKALETGQLPDELGPLSVDGIVYLRTPSAHPVNFPNLVADLCRLLPPERAETLLRRYRDPHETPKGLMLALLDAFPAGRFVVLLDNFEDLIDVGTATIVDTALDEALTALLSAPAHRVKVILTTRIGPHDLMLRQPGVQRRINLDEGLPSPYAEELLRARDPQGTLGLKNATDAQLALARERTRGYPRALEALAAILSADRDTSLPELLEQTAQLPDNVVEALVGEAFHRLDPLAQQIMQALAVYPVPVPAVAVDYLLQPFQPAIDSAPVLTRLVNMQFVRRDAGRYYLHQVDRDYALSRIPTGEASDPLAFTRFVLRRHGAQYFVQVQRPRAEWKTLDDLAPQLAEFELRYQNETYDVAAQVLFGVDFEYLMPWGHCRLVIDLHARLDGRLPDARTSAASKNSLAEAHRKLGEYPRAIALLKQALALDEEIGDQSGASSCYGNLGNCYYQLGQVPRAIELYERALGIDRSIGHRIGEAINLGNLGNCHSDLGDFTRAIDYYERALAITQDIAYREGEADNTGNLGNCYSDLGDFTRAIDYYERALAITEQVNYREGQANHVGNLANSYAHLGQPARAIQLYERALAIDRDIGYRYGEAAHLCGLGDCQADLREWDRAVACYQQSVDVADAIGTAQWQAEARLYLADLHLRAADLDTAWRYIEAAQGHPKPVVLAETALLSGMIRLRQGDVAAAGAAFRTARTRADEQISRMEATFALLDVTFLALAGLTLTGPDDLSADAIAAFRAAREITDAPGVVGRVRRRLDALTPADPAGALHPIRSAVTGDRP